MPKWRVSMFRYLAEEAVMEVEAEDEEAAEEAAHNNVGEANWLAFEWDGRFEIDNTWEVE